MKNSRKNTVCYLALSFCLCALMLSAPLHADEEEPSLKEKKTKEGFIVDLKSLITRSKKKIEEANEKIEEQEVYKRNQEREEKAREYYEKGLKLYEQGKYDKAAEYWERAVKITEHPEMKGYIRHSSAKTKKEQKALDKAEERRLQRLEKERGFKVKEVEKAYDKAVAYFKKEKYIQAQEKFQEVDDMFPDHKATRSYLMLISQKISQEQQDLIDEKLAQDSEEYAQGKKNWKKELEKKAKLRRKHLEEQADKIYKQAVELYKTKQYVAAKEKFKEVEWILPNYKSTIKYLKKLDRTIKVDEVLTQEDKQRLFEKQIREERMAGEDSEVFDELQDADRKKEVEKRLKDEAEFVYKSAVALYKKKKYVESKEMFMEVEEIYPGFKATRKYLSKIEKRIPEYQRDLVKIKKEEVKDAKVEDQKDVKFAVVERREKFLSEAEKKYSEAVNFYRKNNFVEAKIKFIQVEALYPDYRDTRQYLVSIDESISQQLAKGDERAIRGLQVAWEDTQQPVTAPTIPATRENVKDIYKQAVGLYKEKHYELARDKFMQVNNISPGYKGTEKYLGKIYEQLAKKMQTQPSPTPVQPQADTAYLTKQFEGDAKAKYKQALALYKKKRYVEARKMFVEVNELVPGYKSTKKYIKRLDKKVPSIYHEEKKKEQPQEIVKKEAPAVAATPLEEEAERQYQQGLAHYRERQFSKAKKYFKKAMELVPDYKMSSIYISRIEKRLGPEAGLMEEDQKVAAVEAVPDERERKLRDKREAKAEAKSEKSFIRSLSEEKKITKQDERRYKEAKKVIARIKDEEKKEDLHMYERQVNGLYKEALKFYKQKEYDLAKRKFNAVDSLHPDYKSTRHYIKQIDRIKIINEEKERLQKEIEETKEAAEAAKKMADETKKTAMVAQTQTDQVQKSEDSKMSAEEKQLSEKFAQEWKRAEEEVERLERELKEKELALSWRLDQEEKIAQLMAREAELERLEQKKYEEHRKQLERDHEEEEKAIEESKRRIDERVEELKKEYVIQEKLRESASMEASDALEQERDNLRRERDRIVRHRQRPRSFLEDIEMGELSEDVINRLETLEDSIRKEEAQLARDRQAALERLDREKQRRQKLAASRRYKRIDKYTPREDDPSTSFERRYRELTEEENEEALEKLVRARQRELRHERQRIRDQFQDSLDDLYNKAVDLHHAGMYDEARRMFNEINMMAPGYKKTENYLSKIEKTTKWKPTRAQNEYGQDMIRPSMKQLKNRDELISSSLDTFEVRY